MEVDIESAKSTLRSVGARALAEALIDGIDNAAQENRPLTMLQQIDLATMHIMTYETILKGCKLLEIDAYIKEARQTKEST